MGVNSFIALFGIKPEKEKAGLSASLVSNQRGHGAAQKLFSKLLVKIQGFSAFNKKEASATRQSKSALHLPAHALKQVPPTDEPLSQKDFLAKLAMGSLHPVSFDGSEIKSDTPASLIKKTKATAKSASLSLPGGK
ncbi:MAG: hypothetical protein GXO76_05860, partial [Calditrichaeota bacterium]|nr:hypothetical protein [Calditrichota bacterium]